MARLNLDAQFFSDKRIDRLANMTREPAMMTRGRLICLYMHCYHQRTPVLSRSEVDIHTEWPDDSAPFAELMVKCALAEQISEDEFRIRGVADRIGYLQKKSEAGKKSVESRRKKLGSAQPPGGRGHKKVFDAEPNTTEHLFGKESAQTRAFQPNTLVKSGSKRVEITEHQPNRCSVTTEPPSPSPSHHTIKETTYVVPLPNADLKVSKTPARDAIAIYCEIFKKKYGSNPPITKADSGRISQLVKGIGVARILFLLDAYFEMPDQFYIKQRHPISLFVRDLNSVSVFADSGEFVTRKQAQVLETGSQNAKVLSGLLERMGE